MATRREEEEAAMKQLTKATNRVVSLDHEWWGNSDMPNESYKAYIAGDLDYKALITGSYKTPKEAVEAALALLKGQEASND